MKKDIYSKIILTIIACLLAVITIKLFNPSEIIIEQKTSQVINTDNNPRSNSRSSSRSSNEPLDVRIISSIPIDVNIDEVGGWHVMSEIPVKIK